jgi:hypothetical protein
METKRARLIACENNILFQGPSRSASPTRCISAGDRHGWIYRSTEFTLEVGADWRSEVGRFAKVLQIADNKKGPTFR